MSADPATTEHAAPAAPLEGDLSGHPAGDGVPDEAWLAEIAPGPPVWDASDDASVDAPQETDLQALAERHSNDPDAQDDFLSNLWARERLGHQFEVVEQSVHDFLSSLPAERLEALAEQRDDQGRLWLNTEAGMAAVEQAMHGDTLQKVLPTAAKHGRTVAQQVKAWMREGAPEYWRDQRVQLLYRAMIASDMDQPQPLPKGSASEINAELSRIEGLMRTDRKRYFRENLDVRYRELLEMRQ